MEGSEAGTRQQRPRGRAMGLGIRTRVHVALPAKSRPVAAHASSIKHQASTGKDQGPVDRISPHCGPHRSEEGHLNDRLSLSLGVLAAFI